MAATPPATLAEFKVRFARDFQFGDGQDKVMDTDVNSAMADAMPVFNPALFDTDTGKLAFLMATAHFVVTNVQAAGGLSGRPHGLGIDNVPEELISSKNVGGISLSVVEPPDIVKNNQVLRQFWTTDYGRRYLSMVTPKLRGAFGAVEGPLMPDAGVPPGIPFSEFT